MSEDLIAYGAVVVGVALMYLLGYLKGRHDSAKAAFDPDGPR